MNKILKSPVFIRLCTVALSFLAGVIVNRSLGIELKGQYTTITNCANFVQLALNLGVCYIYPVLRRENETKAKKAVMSLIWLQTIALVVILTVVLLCSFNIRTLEIAVLSVLLVCNNQIIFISLIDDIMRRNLILLWSTVAYTFLNIIVFILNPGNINVIIIILALKYLFEIVVCTKENKLFVFDTKTMDSSVKKQMLITAFPTAVLAVLISCNYNLDIIMLNWMNSGDIEVGIYGVAYSLSSMLWIVPDVFKELIYNKTSKSSADSKMIIKLIAINMAICVVICVGFLVLGKIFLRIVYGEQYVVAFNTTMTLFIGIIPMISFKLIHPIYVNDGRSILVTCLLMVSVITNVFASYLLIPSYGAYGAAIASVISYSTCGLLFFIKYRIDYCKKDIDTDARCQGRCQ